jgi:cysteine desulfurase/selenocysteine lyase
MFEQEINGRRLVFLDNGATTLKPVQVLEAVYNYNTRAYGNLTGKLIR